MIQTKKASDYLSIWFEPSLISYRNGYAGENGLYDQVFRQGWHGGANINGEMLVPWAAPPIVYDGDKTPWSSPIKHSWKQAEKAPISPLQDFKRRINQYQKTEYQKDYENIWNKYKSNIKIDI